MDILIETINSTPEEIDNIFKNIIKNDNDLKLIENQKREKFWIRFISNKINTKKLQFAKEDWVKSNEIIMIEINNTTQKDIYADIIVRTVDEINDKKRDNILEIAKKEFKENFNYETLKKDEYAHVYSVNLIEGKKYYDIASYENLGNYLTKALYKSKIIKTFEAFANKVCQSV